MKLYLSRKYEEYVIISPLSAVIFTLHSLELAEWQPNSLEEINSDRLIRLRDNKGNKVLGEKELSAPESHNSIPSKHRWSFALSKAASSAEAPSPGASLGVCTFTSHCAGVKPEVFFPFSQDA